MSFQSLIHFHYCLMDVLINFRYMLTAQLNLFLYSLLQLFLVLMLWIHDFLQIVSNLILQRLNSYGLVFLVVFLPHPLLFFLVAVLLFLLPLFRVLVFILTHLSFSAHISSVTLTCFYNLRQLRQIRRSLSRDSLAVLVQAFVSTRLDYCNSSLVGNSCLVGAPAYILSCLQSVLNAAARLIANLPRRSHITPMFKDLHWLLFLSALTSKYVFLSINVYMGLLHIIFHSTAFLLLLYLEDRKSVV